MSKYKVGDKVVYEVKEIIRDGVYLLSGWKESEPLSTYTEPLEAKIRRQAAEITRLLAENKRLWATNKHMESESMRVIVENNELRKEMEQAEVEGAEAAWELARKIVRQPINGGYKRSEFEEIFGCGYISDIFEKYTYPEAAAKVEAWEKAKEEIKVGDVLKDVASSNVKCVVTNMYPGNMAYLVFSDGSAGMHELENMKKTGRHIDIDGFLKQIGEEQ